jgi:hypothetical protein
LKIVLLIVREAEIVRECPKGFLLWVEDDASVIDVIEAVDREVREKCGTFPVRRYQRLLSMVCRPNEKRFDSQVAIQAYEKSNMFLNARENPETPIPNETTIVLVPEGGCATDWEEPVK